MKVPLLDLKGQYQGIKDECMSVIEQVCDDQYFIMGPRVAEFEKNVAEYCGASYAIGASSGTDAILLSLMALDIGHGDAVITTPYTFFATAGCIARVGAVPVFVDIDPVSFNIDPQEVRRLLENIPENLAGLNIKAIMPVHLYGQMAEMNDLMDIAEEFDLKVIEDSAQAIGAEYMYKGEAKRAGTIGDAGCFSFFPSKNLGGFGDGGMIVTNDSELADKMVKLRNHGMDPKYYHPMIGGNFRLDAMQAAVLDIKLKLLEDWHEGRRANAAVYNAGFEGSSVRTPAAVNADSGVKNYHIYNQYIVRVDDRDAAREKMTEAEIGTEIYYPVPMHLQECFSRLGYSECDMPHSEQAARETMALPIYPELTDEMLEYVVKTLSEV